MSEQLLRRRPEGGRVTAKVEPLPMPRSPLWSRAGILLLVGFPAVVVASSDDPYCTLDRARHFASSWGATFAEAGSVGHINTVSGHGPWPEGAMRFGWFLKQLGTAPDNPGGIRTRGAK